MPSADQRTNTHLRPATGGFEPLLAPAPSLPALGPRTASQDPRNPAEESHQGYHDVTTIPLLLETFGAHLPVCHRDRVSRGCSLLTARDIYPFDCRPKQRARERGKRAPRQGPLGCRASGGSCRLICKEQHKVADVYNVRETDRRQETRIRNHGDTLRFRMGL